MELLKSFSMSFCWVFSFLYIVLFTVTSVYLKQPSILISNSALFNEGKFVFPCMFLSMLIIFYFGKFMARNEVAYQKIKLDEAVHKQATRLAEYVDLARIVTREDATTIVEKYFKKLEINK